MIVEVADFKTDNPQDFEEAMSELVDVIGSSAGYRGHAIQRSCESPGRYLLIVRWEDLESHTVGFRGSAAFTLWAERLGEHRSGAVVEHFETIIDHRWGAWG